MAEFFNAPDIWAPFGPFSHGVVTGDGIPVHLKGQIPLNSKGEIVGQGDMRLQVEMVLENIQAVLHTVGGVMSDIVSITQYTTDIDAFMECGDIRKQYFQAPYPISTTLGVARLYHTEILVEIAVTAEIPINRFKSPKE